ncbi:DUF4139 domain-containing protein [Marinicella sediminis]|uniref:DUF4139 domain-containing protein n=1 Tax=Marinicella sediminis TaxID=1792834 RepID=A0ABV7JEJ4_9GAMM|nr:DUF4139 domain-containing protein [Marinicella sediminis]
MKKAILLTAMMAAGMSKANNQITIYSGNHQGALNTSQLTNAHNIPGFAVVNEHRQAEFTEGRFTLSINDVAEHIDPTTVTLKLDKNPDDIQILDQDFQFDLVSTEKLLLKYIDQSITVNHNQGDESIQTTGILLSTEGGLTLRTEAQKITTIKDWNQIEFPELPGGLLTRPTLVWLMESQVRGNQSFALSYQTKGMTWWVDYNILLSNQKKQCRMDLSTWVTLVNKSGTGFTETQLKLIAGDVNRVQRNQPRAIRKEAFAMTADSQFSEESLFEYHLYQLPRRVDLPNNATKQIPFLPAIYDIECRHVLEYNGSQMQRINYHRPVTDRNYLQTGNTKIDAFLLFDNDSENQLGHPLPAGRMRVNMMDSQGDNPQFIGEDYIDHTADNKTISLKLGQSFDVTGSRTQIDFQSEKHSMTEQFRIVLDNQKNHPQLVEVIEPLYRWSQWQIIAQSDDHEKLNASTIKFTVEVPAKSSKTVTYQVRYDWQPGQ